MTPGVLSVLGILPHIRTFVPVLSMARILPHAIRGIHNLAVFHALAFARVLAVLGVLPQVFRVLPRMLFVTVSGVFAVSGALATLGRVYVKRLGSRTVDRNRHRNARRSLLRRRNDRPGDGWRRGNHIGGQQHSTLETLDEHREPSGNPIDLPSRDTRRATSRTFEI